jgi:3-oxoacyl-[acyl-carrier-protein] synthase II
VIVRVEKGERRVSPFLVPMMMVNASGAAMSMRYGLQGRTRRSAPPAPPARTPSATPPADQVGADRRRRHGRRRVGRHVTALAGFGT